VLELGDSKRSGISKGSGRGPMSVGSKASTKKSMGSVVIPGLADETEEVVNRLGSNEKRMLQIRNAIISVFEEMGSQSRTISIPMFLILHFIGFLQLLLLPLSPSSKLPWRAEGAGMSNIIIVFQSFLLNATLVPWVDGFGKLSEFPEYTIWGICAFFSSACLVLFSWSFWRALQGLPRIKNSLRISVLCFVTYISTIALPVPIIANLLGPILCSSLSPRANANTLWNTYRCWSSQHLGIFAFSLISLIAIIIFFVLATLLFQTRSPDPKNFPIAVVNGRFDCIAVCVKVILAIFYACGYNLSSWVHGSINVFGSSILVAVYIRFLPHMNPRLNMYISTLYAGFFASSAACFIAISVASGSGPEFASASGGIIWIFLFPLCCFLGWTISETRWRLVGKSNDMSNVDIIELRLRWLLAEGLRLQKSAAITNRMFSSESHSSVPDDVVVSVPTTKSSASMCPVAPDRGAAENDTLPDGHPVTIQSDGATSRGQRKNKASTRIQSAPKPPTYGIFGQGLSQINEATSENIRTIRKLLEEALLMFPNSALMRIYAAHVVRASQGNVYLELSHLRNAYEIADATELDVILFSNVRQSQLNDEKQRIMTGKMTVEMRIHFEQQMQIAAQKVGACRLAILTFWNSLCESNPDLIALETKGVAIYAATKESESLFRELLSLVPTSIPVLRAYSEFLLEVTNNPGLASELMNDADQIEDEASKLQSILKDVDDFEFGSPATFDMTSDGTALMSVSSRMEVDQFGGIPSLGVIQFGNSAALRVLGYSNAKRELLGKEMSLIIVNPIASIHPQYLSTFVKTGNQRLTGSSRNLFALHRTGYIVPIMGIVQATGDQWLVAFEEVPAPHIAFLWVTDANSNWKVTAACRRSISLFGITMASLRTGSVSMSNFYTDMDGLIDKVLTSPGSIVQLRGLPRKRGENLEIPEAPLASGTTTTGATGHFRVFCQELTVPLVASTIYIFKFLAASSADVKAAQQAGLIPMTENDEEFSDDSESGEDEDEYDDDEDRESVDEPDDDDDDDESENELSGFGAMNKSAKRNFDSDSIDAQSAGSNDNSENDHDDDQRRKGKDGRVKTFKSTSKHLKAKETKNIDKTVDVTSTKVSKSIKSKEDIDGENVVSDNPDQDDADLNSVPSRRSSTVPHQRSHKHVDEKKKPLVAAIKSAVKTSAVRTRVGGNAGARVGFAEPSEPSIVFVEERPGPSIRFAEVPSHGPIHFEELRDSPVNETSEVTVSDLPPPSSSPPALLNERFVKDSSFFKRTSSGQAKQVKAARTSSQQPAPEPLPAPSSPSPAKVIKEAEKTSKLASFFKVKPTSKRNIAASVASGESNNSRTMSTTEQIRAGVALRSRTMELSLVRLRSSVIFVFLVICITNIASYVVTRILTEIALSRIIDLRELAHVGTYVRKTVKTIQLATLETDDRCVYNVSIAWHREELTKYVDLSEKKYKEIYKYAESTGNEEEINMYREPRHNSTSLVPDSYVDKDTYNVSIDIVSLNDLMIGFASRIRSVWYYDHCEYLHNDSDLFWIEHTANRELVDALNETIFIEAAKTEDIESVRLGNTVVLAVALTVFFIISFSVIIPATYDVLREQREVFEVFAAVPIKVIRHIRDRLSERIAFLVREAAGEEAGEDIDLSAGGFTPNAQGDQGVDKDDASIGSENKGLRMRPGGSLSLVIAQGVAKDASRASRDNDDDDPKRAAMIRRRDAFYACFFCFRKPELAKVSSSRRFRRDGTGVADLLMKMLWPILLFSGYYVGMYIQRASVADTASTARISVHWAAELEVLVPAVGYSFRNAAIFSEPHFTNEWLANLEKHADFMDYVIGAITYGDDEVGLPSLISTSPGAFFLLMKDGCVDNTLPDEECARRGQFSGCVGSYTIDLCKKPYDSVDVNRPVFASGVVGTGLTPAIQYFSRAVNNLIRDRHIEYETLGHYLDHDLDHNTKYKVMSEMASNYLSVGLSALTNVIVEEVKATIQAAMDIDILSVVCSILALVVIYFFLYDPLVRNLDKEIKRTRFLLLLFPEEVAKGVPSVVAAGKKLMKNM
jgi:hypothetical protein